MHGKTEIAALHSGNAGNARLIAAAPDLLAALQAIVDAHGAAEDHPGQLDPMFDAIVGQAYPAIAKATKS
jgi:hypothetical protein